MGVIPPEWSRPPDDRTVCKGYLNFDSNPPGAVIYIKQGQVWKPLETWMGERVPCTKTPCLMMKQFYAPRRFPAECFMLRKEGYKDFGPVCYSDEVVTERGVWRGINVANLEKLE